jgi:hypothetical protein
MNHNVYQPYLEQIELKYCKDNPNCYYKQLQACKEENGKLTKAIANKDIAISKLQKSFKDGESLRNINLIQQNTNLKTQIEKLLLIIKAQSKRIDDLEQQNTALQKQVDALTIDRTIALERLEKIAKNEENKKTGKEVFNTLELAKETIERIEHAN